MPASPVFLITVRSIVFPNAKPKNGIIVCVALLKKARKSESKLPRTKPTKNGKIAPINACGWNTAKPVLPKISIVTKGPDSSDIRMYSRIGSRAPMYMPGCITITEMKHALEAGVDIVKLFPGNAFGPDFVKAVKAPLPQVNIMPTDGVDLNNIEEWIQNGSVAVGVGGNLIAPGKNGEYDQVTDNAIQYMEKVRAAKKSLNWRSLRC